MSRLKRWFKEALLLLLAGAVMLWGMDRLRAPTLPPDTGAMQVQTLQGETHTLAELSREKPLLVYVWATWCGICKLTTPVVADMLADGTSVLSIALRSGDDERVKAWLTKKGLNGPAVNDNDGRLAQRWDIGVTPTFIIIKNGNVVSTASGWSSRWGLQLRLWWAQRTA